VPFLIYPSDKYRSDSMQYENMIVEASDAQLVRTEDKRRLGRFKLRVLLSPAGEMRPEDAVAVEYDDRLLQSRLRDLEGRRLDRAGMIALGRELAQLLLPPKQAGAATGLRDLFTASLAQIGPDVGLRLRLRLPPLLAALPWEYMYLDRAGGGEGIDGFMALDPRLAIVRHESLPAPAPLPVTTGALKVVAALASAAGLPQLDLDKERADLEQSFADQPGVAPVFLPDATLDEVLAAIPGAGVFHFAGHGVFAQQLGDLPGTYTGSGALALDDLRVDAEQLGVNLRGNGVRLAVLGGCETGRRDGVSVWSGIAPALVKAEMPAVIANQFPIKDSCAIAFSKHFYRALVGGLPIERAVSAGRIAAYNADPEGRDWGVAVLYLRAADGHLFGGAADEGARQQAAASTQATVQKMINAGLYIAGNVNTGGGDFIGRDKIVYGDEVRGDKIEGDKISVGNITGSTGIAIGRGASATVTQGLGGPEIAALFESVYSAIKARPVDADLDKAEITGMVEKIQAEAAKGEQANPTKVERWLSNLAEMAPDIFDVAVATLQNPVAGIAMVVRKIAAKAKQSRTSDPT